MRRLQWYRTGAATILWLLVFAMQPRAVATLSLGETRDPRYLAYQIDILKQDYDSSQCRPIIDDPAWVVWEPGDSLRARYIGVAINPKPGENRSPQTMFCSYPNWSAVSDEKVPVTILDVVSCQIGHTKPTSCFGLGCRNDSAFVFQVTAGGSSYREIPICHIESIHTPYHPWYGGGRFLPIRESEPGWDEGELLFQISASRDFAPDLLVCMNTSNMDIKWSVELAGDLFRNNFHGCRDRSGRGFLFATYNPKNGHQAGGLDDENTWIARVDMSGQLVWKMKAGEAYGGAHIWPLADDSIFCVSHTIPLNLHDSDRPEGGNYISIIDANANVLRTLAVTDRVIAIWTIDSPDRKKSICALNSLGVLSEYDPNLRILQQSNPSSFSQRIGEIDSFYGEGHVTFVGASDRVGIFNDRLQLLAMIPKPFAKVYPLARNSTDLEVIATAANSYMICRIVPMTIAAYASQFYYEYQSYILACMVSLIVALLLVNSFRRRTKRNLALISSQKALLEQGHLDLERAHAQLRDAQQQIISQEKFRQAKEIAGGLSHEIKNALFPADGAIVRLSELSEAGAVDAGRLDTFLESIHSAISRAIKITNLVSQYTKLDTQYFPERVSVAEVVRFVIREHRQLLDAGGVRVTICDGGESPVAEANEVQIGMVFTNLLMNSIDAMANQENPNIVVELSTVNDRVHISFSDNGCGVSEGNLTKIFDAFYSTKPNRGTGLGLSVTRKIVEMYGGSIAATSVVGRGTRFDLGLKKYQETESDTYQRDI